MSKQYSDPRRGRLTSVAVSLAGALLVWGAPADARVTRIIIDRVIAGPTGQPIAYEQVIGRAFGELDPNNPQNTVLTDIDTAPRNASGKVEYIASFIIVKPVTLSQSSGLAWHDVPNRGGRIVISSDLRTQGDIGISSGWQGDNAGATAVIANADSLASLGAVNQNSNEWVKTPVLTGTTGRIFGRIINRGGGNQPLNVMGNPIPYFPANSADNSDAVMKTHTGETINGIITEGPVIPNSSWKFCYGAGATFASPGTPAQGLPVRVCMNGTFDPALLYQLEYTVKDPYMLGAGTAAFRDVMAFFRYQAQDDFGTANPIAGAVRAAIVRGSSQSGNFTRHYLYLGMNEEETASGSNGRIVHEGAWPLIAGRRVANNSRWGQPDGVLELYQMGSEGPQWWTPWPDTVRNLPTKGILDRCNATATNTCPKIVETFGGAEVFQLKMTTSWVGTSADKDIPVPRNVRRYYLPSSTHGGGGGGFDELPSNTPANCPGNNWGNALFRANPVPATALVNKLRVALREWVLNGTLPPTSRYPTLVGKNLVDPTRAAMGFPNLDIVNPDQGNPNSPTAYLSRNGNGIRNSVFLPENFIFPVFDYDWGPNYDHTEASGVPTNAPPPIKHVIKMKVPRTDADGNEMGGVPTVLRDAPLGTYLGFNVTAGPNDPSGFTSAGAPAAVFQGAPFHAGQLCNYVGGMIPFARTKAQRLAAGDPRLSLEERYVTHNGYVAAVKAAADNAACQGYMLVGPEAASNGATPKCPGSVPAGFPNDWKVLMDQAIASNVCTEPGNPGAPDGGRCAP